MIEPINPSQISKKPNPKAPIAIPTQVVREAVSIDPTSPTGLRWTIRPCDHFKNERAMIAWNSKMAGKIAGSETQKRKSSNRYWVIRINGRAYRSHRIAYFLAHGIDAGDKFLDHINGNGMDNRIENLRLATCQENLRNQRKTDKNTSGVVGVTWDKRNQKWQAQITVHPKTIFLGRFTEFSQAVAARQSAEKRYFGCFSYSASQGISIAS
jgi:hypothetical protein